MKNAAPGASERESLRILTARLSEVLFAVSHSTGEYARDQAHTNGMESFWSMMKRGYQGTYHKMSPKHLNRYVGEFEGRHNQRPLDTIEQMQVMVMQAEDKKLRYKDLIRRNGLDSGANSPWKKSVC